MHQGLSKKVRYQTKADFAIEAIREAVLNHTLAPGERIDPEAVADQLGLSLMPVRNALIRLAESGLVIHKPHRGAFVAPISIEQIREVYLIRSSLEGLAARLATEQMTPEILSKLKEILQEAQTALKSSDWDELNRLNAEFHLSGYEVIQLPLLKKLIHEMRTHSERYRILHSRLTSRTNDAFQEHEKILEAWREGDAQGAETWTKTNIDNSALHLIKSLQSDPETDRVMNL